MSWFMRGVQSAIFHYASCAPCTGYIRRKKRRKQARKDVRAADKLKEEQPDLYHHPGPTGTNPYWGEEIVMGPGPPPRRGKRTNTSGSQKGLGNASTVVSQAGSSVDFNRSEDTQRHSDDTDDENWNRRRYQREDEDLWGMGDLLSPSKSSLTRGSSVGGGGGIRPGTSKSSAESYFTARAPPVNDLHPPIVSIPSPHASDNHWMLQPPPKASIMAGKERATNRSRSGSGASSHVELSLQRQVSARQLKVKLARGETPEMPPLSRGSSYNNLIMSQRQDRPKTPQVRPPSAASSRRSKKRRSTHVTAPTEATRSSGESSDTIVRSKGSVKFAGSDGTPPTSITNSPELPSAAQIPPVILATPPTAKGSPVSSLKVVRVRGSRQRLSTVLSSGAGVSPTERSRAGSDLENQPARRGRYTSEQSSDSTPYLMKHHRTPLLSSDASSLNVLQDLVSPQTLLNSRFVSAPLLEARFRLPTPDREEETTLNSIADKDWVNTDAAREWRGTDGSGDWVGSGFGISRAWNTDKSEESSRAVPFDSRSGQERDPRMRWSVDF